MVLCCLLEDWLPEHQVSVLFFFLFSINEGSFSFFSNVEEFYVVVLFDGSEKKL